MKKLLWHCGTAVDVLHLPLALFLTLFGRLFVPEWLWLTTVLAVLGLQLWLRTCPLNLLVIWLKHFHDPSYVHQSSIVSRVYGRYGRVRGLLLLSSVIGSTAALSWAVGGLKLPTWF